MTTPIAVVSFPRSGTHFLINSLALNFGYSATTVVNLPQDLSKNDRKGIAQNVTVPRKIHAFKSEIESWIDPIIESHHVFYIQRDPRGVMASLYRYYRDSPVRRKESFDAMLDRNMMEFHRLPLDAWNEHMLEWSDVPGVRVVRFEDLHRNFESVIRAIGSEKGFKIANQKIARPTPFSHMSVSPGKGTHDGWKHVLSLEQADRVVAGTRAVFQRFFKDCP